jgi:hypothetical protein
MNLCSLQIAWSAQTSPLDAAQSQASDGIKDFPISKSRGQPLPKSTIVICSDQPDWALASVTKLVDQKFSRSEYSVVDGRQGQIFTDATMAYFANSFSVSVDDPCLVRYPRLREEVVSRLSDGQTATRDQICSSACPPFMDAIEEYPTLSRSAYTYDGSPSQIETYVSFCVETFCRTEQLLGLFQLEPVPAQ